MSRRKIQWDEETISAHDKERGTRQKIDEPPTPYHYDDMETDNIDELYKYEENNEVVFKFDDVTQNGKEHISNNNSVSSLSSCNDVANHNTNSGNVMDQWEVRNAKLVYEESVQEQQQDKKEKLNEIGELDSEHEANINANPNVKSRNSSEFANKRASHYNEFKVLQAMRAKMRDDEDEDD